MTGMHSLFEPVGDLDELAERQGSYALLINRCLPDNLPRSFCALGFSYELKGDSVIMHQGGRVEGYFVGDCVDGVPVTPQQPFTLGLQPVVSLTSPIYRKDGIHIYNLSALACFTEEMQTTIGIYASLCEEDEDDY